MDSVGCQLHVQLLAGYPERPGYMGLVAFEDAHRPDDQHPLRFAQEHDPIERQRRWARTQILGHAGRQIGLDDLRPFTKSVSSLYGIFQLANIPWPRVPHEDVQSLLVDTFDMPVIDLVEFLQEV